MAIRCYKDVTICGGDNEALNREVREGAGAAAAAQPSESIWREHVQRACSEGPCSFLSQAAQRLGSLVAPLPTAGPPRASRLQRQPIVPGSPGRPGLLHLLSLPSSPLPLHRYVQPLFAPQLPASSFLRWALEVGRSPKPPHAGSQCGPAAWPRKWGPAT